jgi:polyhydroxybutyrate depolymerase
MPVGGAGAGGTSGTTAGSAGTAGGGAASGGSSSTPVCPSGATATPGETMQTVMVDGMERTFIRRIPLGYTGDMPVPVVIDFHPVGGTGSSWKGSTGWAELADDEGFIMIWPDGIGNSWNAGRCCRTALEQNVDDIGFTRAIIAKLTEEACVDPKRVYATGCSNGGGMAFRVACDAADVVAGVAPVDFDCVTSADVNARSCGPECSPPLPITEVQFRGTNDTAVPYEGGLRSGGTTTFPGAQETFASFGEINMCTGNPVELAGEPSCETYPSCSGGVETVLCTIQGGTHCGSYGSFQIPRVAWEILSTTLLP